MTTDLVPVPRPDGLQGIEPSSFPEDREGQLLFAASEVFRAKQAATKARIEKGAADVAMRDAETPMAYAEARILADDLAGKVAVLTREEQMAESEYKRLRPYCR